jgi:hypothetical protein
MTKKNRIGVIIANVVVLVFALLTPTAYAKSAPMAGESATAVAQPFVSTSFAEAPSAKANKKKKTKKWKCKNQLANWLHVAGFRGMNLREAWAISMRESNGKNVGPGMVQFNGHDYGLFQFNIGAWAGSSWWDTASLLTPKYNAKVAFKLSRGGKSWIPWGMRDNMDFDTQSYAGIWSSDQFYAWVIEPYQRYYAQYPCK